jgi:hypothetical protein
MQPRRRSIEPVTTSVGSDDGVEVDDPSTLELGHLEIAQAHLRHDLLAGDAVEGGELARDLLDPSSPEPTGRRVPEHRCLVVVTARAQR